MRLLLMRLRHVLYISMCLVGMLVLVGCETSGVKGEHIAVTSSFEETRAAESISIAAPEEKREPLSIAAVGDVMLGGKGLAILNEQSYDYPFAATRHLIAEADVAIANLETALTARGEPVKDKRFVFRNDPVQVPRALRRAGFDIVSLANNHSMDFGAAGLQDTIEALSRVGILSHGAGMSALEARAPRIVNRREQTVGFLAYSNTFPKEFWAKEQRPGTAFGHEQDVREDVAALVQQGMDVIVVSFHWGRELDPELREYQPLLAHAAIDAGADVVFGHHPHILQGVEHYRDGIILYSLGNYTFSSFSERVQTSVVASVHFDAGKFSWLELTPIAINNFEVQLQPQILVGERAAAVQQELQLLSSVPLQLENNKIIYRPAHSATAIPLSE